MRWTIAACVAEYQRTSNSANCDNMKGMCWGLLLWESRGRIADYTNVGNVWNVWSAWNVWNVLSVWNAWSVWRNN